MSELVDISGRRFGRLKVLRRKGSSSGRGGSKWLCICDCGSVRIVRSHALRHGITRSCGCFHRKVSHENAIHGGWNTRLYSVWSSMKQRCFNPLDDAYPNYGGRGISVCDRWRYSFANFRDDMGPRPSKNHSIDRIDNDGNYEPSNCRWATRHQQQTNQRPHYGHRKISSRQSLIIKALSERGFSLNELSVLYGVYPQTIGTIVRGKRHLEFSRKPLTIS